MIELDAVAAAAAKIEVTKSGAKMFYGQFDECS